MIGGVDLAAVPPCSVIVDPVIKHATRRSPAPEIGENPVASIVGVVSEVMESEFESPRSEAVATLGVPVADKPLAPTLGEVSFALP